jgi:hypothetical protein
MGSGYMARDSSCPIHISLGHSGTLDKIYNILHHWDPTVDFTDHTKGFVSH